MHKFSYVALIALLVVVMHLCSCSGTGVIDPTDPIMPSPEIKEGTVEPASRIITVAKEDVTVAVQHWSKTRLNRKYTTVGMRSPFYYLETWAQSFQTEAFHVTITNNTPRNVVVAFEDITMTDDRDYEYNTITDLKDIRYKFVSRKLMDMRTKNGLQKATEIMLSSKLGKKNQILPGKSMGGFVIFNTPSKQSVKIQLKIVVEKEPEVRTAAYEKVVYMFDYIQDLILLKRQPATKRT